MNSTATERIKDADVVLLVIEANKECKISKGDCYLLEKLKQSHKKAILIINKIDKINKIELAKMIDLYKNEYDFKAIVPTIALKNNGIEEILLEIEKILPNGPIYYNLDEYTDQTERMIVEEKIREKALKLLNDEVPHGLYVEVDKLKQRKTINNEDIYDIDATIFCLKKSHKGIIIGKNGNMLKKIGTYARQDLEEMFDIKINLNLWVKIKEDWIDNEQFVNNKFKE